MNTKNKQILKLNPEQKKAIQHGEGPLLVLAGAGSGKTKVVTERIAHLVSLGIQPSDILAVTFTNKAAKEMQARLAHKFPTTPLICTFHSLGARILREKIHFFGYQNNFTIYDEEDSFKLLKNCFKTLALDESLLKEMRYAISKAKNDLKFKNLFKVSEAEGEKKETMFLQVFNLYQTRLKEYNAVDFNDLLYIPVKLLQESKEALQEYQKRWKFFLIDEYQDTNHAQYELSHLLAGGHKNIFAVGDPDQSIYSWRGARYKNILNFEKDFPGAKTIALEQNYRSANTILKAANALISNNENRRHKELFSELGEGEKIQLVFLDSEKEEARFVVKKILHYYTEKKLSLNEIVIFYRTNAQSRIFEDLLLSAKIPYVIYGGVSFYQRKEIKDILAYLKLIVSDSDFLAFTRSVNLPKRGLGAVSLNKLIDLSEEKQIPILKFLKSYLENPNQTSQSFQSSTFKLGTKQIAALEQYLNLIYDLRKKVANKEPLFEIISELIERSHYLDYLKEDTEKFAERKENLDELIAKASEYEETHPENALISFLEELSLLSNTETKEQTESLKLMTLHNGKGLEFNTVFITGLEEDLFPHINSKESLESLEEERRLFYVGMTRAKKKLFISSVSYRYLFGTPRMMTPSRFLSEIPEEFIEKAPSQSCSWFGRKRLFQKSSTDEDYADEEFEDTDYISDKADEEKKETSFSVGDQVVHSSFGTGTIRKSYNSSFGQTYDVWFERENVKHTLAAKYAKLKPYRVS